MAVGDGFWHTDGSVIKDAAGNIVRFSGVNWHGMDGDNLIPHGLWGQANAANVHTIERHLDEMKATGFNLIRLAFSSEIFLPGQKPKPVRVSSGAWQSCGGAWLLHKSPGYHVTRSSPRCTAPNARHWAPPKMGVRTLRLLHTYVQLVFKTPNLMPGVAVRLLPGKDQCVACSDGWWFHQKWWTLNNNLLSLVCSWEDVAAVRVTSFQDGTLMYHTK